MAAALEEQLTNSACAGLGFEERLALLADRELHHRHDKRLAELLKRAKLKYPQACIEDVHTGSGRGLNRNAFTQLALSRWVDLGMTISVIGPTGSGKSWLACALAQQACRRAHSALYLRVPRLTEELRIPHGKGGFAAWLATLARAEVLVLDDWALAPLEPATRADLLEIIDDRAGTPGRATIVTTLLPAITGTPGWVTQLWPTRSCHQPPEVQGALARRACVCGHQEVMGLQQGALSRPGQELDKGFVAVALANLYLARKRLVV